VSENVDFVDPTTETGLPEGLNGTSNIFSDYLWELARDTGEFLFGWTFGTQPGDPTVEPSADGTITLSKSPNGTPFELSFPVPEAIQVGQFTFRPVVQTQNNMIWLLGGAALLFFALQK